VAGQEFELEAQPVPMGEIVGVVACDQGCARVLEREIERRREAARTGVVDAQARLAVSVWRASEASAGTR